MADKRLVQGEASGLGALAAELTRDATGRAIGVAISDPPKRGERAAPFEPRAPGAGAAIPPPAATGAPKTGAPFRPRVLGGGGGRGRGRGGRRALGLDTDAPAAARGAPVSAPRGNDYFASLLKKK